MRRVSVPLALALLTAATSPCWAQGGGWLDALESARSLVEQYQGGAEAEDSESGSGTSGFSLDQLELDGGMTDDGGMRGSVGFGDFRLDLGASGQGLSADIKAGGAGVSGRVGPDGVIGSVSDGFGAEVQGRVGPDGVIGSVSDGRGAGVQGRVGGDGVVGSVSAPGGVDLQGRVGPDGTVAADLGGMFQQATGASSASPYLASATGLRSAIQSLGAQGADVSGLSSQLQALVPQLKSLDGLWQRVMSYASRGQPAPANLSEALTRGDEAVQPRLQAISSQLQVASQQLAQQMMQRYRGGR